MSLDTLKQVAPFAELTPAPSPLYSTVSVKDRRAFSQTLQSGISIPCDLPDLAFNAKAFLKGMSIFSQDADLAFELDPAGKLDPTGNKATIKDRTTRIGLPLVSLNSVLDFPKLPKKPSWKPITELHHYAQIEWAHDPMSTRAMTQGIWVTPKGLTATNGHVLAGYRFANPATLDPVCIPVSMLRGIPESGQYLLTQNQLFFTDDPDPTDQSSYRFASLIQSQYPDMESLIQKAKSQADARIEKAILIDALKSAKVSEGQCRWDVEGETISIQNAKGQSLNWTKCFPSRMNITRSRRNCTRT